MGEGWILWVQPRWRAEIVPGSVHVFEANVAIAIRVDQSETTEVAAGVVEVDEIDHAVGIRITKKRRGIANVLEFVQADDRWIAGRPGEGESGVAVLMFVRRYDQRVTAIGLWMTYIGSAERRVPNRRFKAIEWPKRADIEIE